ncbi:MAG TPA: hypothetical protein VGA53_00710 [Candidatus Paceibacterota bacterium]
MNEEQKTTINIDRLRELATQIREYTEKEKEMGYGSQKEYDGISGDEGEANE